MGLDGFGVGFVKHYWHIIAKDMFNCILEFFTNRKILEGLNHTFATLICKVNNRSKTNHFRPINLRSKVYKIVLKMLVDRLQPD